MSGFRTSDAIGAASAATTDGLTVPRYGLAYDLGSGQWTNAAQFQQFTRDLLPVTQQAAQAQAKQIDTTTQHALALQRAQMFEQHGIEFDVSPQEAIAYSHAGTVGKLGWEAKKAVSIIGHAFGGLGAMASNLVHGDTSLPDNAYQQYTKNGGLLTEDEFNSFSDGTKLRLLGESRTHNDLKDVLGAPVIHQVGEGVGLAYRGLTTSADVVGNTVMSGRPAEYFDPSQWAKGWREAQGESLGNSLVNLALDPFYSQEQLDRWKRDNPWYQLTSMGVELGATWYADPTVLAGKGLGAAARFKTLQFPIREDSSAAIALRQATQRQTITVRSPLAKGYAKVQAHRIDNQWDKLKQAATVLSPSEFAQLPMFSQRYRAIDGSAGAYALHWAANNEQTVKDMLGPHIDAFDLTRNLVMGDPNAYAMLRKLHDIPPEEMQRVAPGAGSLLNSMDALKTKADALQQEVDDLLAEADRIDAGTSTSKALPMFHRWEIHTSLADKQSQLAQAQDMLQRYAGDETHMGYKDWLDLSTNSNPLLSRVQAPRKRWSLVRNTPGDGDYEQRQLFMDNQFGTAHSRHVISKSLYLKRANAVEIHSLDSGIMSINRQFDQFEHLFGYAPEGARQDVLHAYVKAGSSDHPEFDRYKILHDLEETHLIGGIAQKFNIDPEMARAIVHKIHDERNRTIDGILSGDDSMYRSAPSIGDRLNSGTDQTLQLVNKDDESGIYTVNLMNGRHMQTYQVPASAFDKRVAPEDVTQTPNYYNPLDTRRLYHELKHDPKMLEELNAGFLQRDKAALAETAQWAGTKFNEFWKPVQLFRLGWPMRVLMDEGARATAIFGPMYWLTGPGMESVYTAGRNILPNVANAIARKRKGPLGVDMGPGPITDAAKQTPNQFERAAEVRDAVTVPQDYFPKIDPARLEAIRGHFNEWDQWDRAMARAKANQEFNRSEVPQAVQDAILNPGTEITPLQHKLIDYRLGPGAQSPGAMPLGAPVFKAVREHTDRLAREGTAKATEEGPLVFDPARGTQHKTGYIVPLPDHGYRLAANQEQSRQLMNWYNQKGELLSRTGMRIVVQPDGMVTVGKHFTSNHFKDAQQFAQYVTDKHPDVKMWDLGRKQFHVVQDANDASPIAQQSLHYWVNEEKKALTPGKAPIEGEPAVYHGASRNLPEDLLPRDQVPADNGRMLGPGLYTSLDRRFIEESEYNSAGVYTIKGSKSGKQYKVWDLDQPITPEQHAGLMEFLRRQSVPPEDLRSINELINAPVHSYYMTRTGHVPGHTWANLYEDLAGIGVTGSDYHNLLHDYLEREHSVGALTHTGGTRHGHQHQVYVWLHPEDLLVKPAYAGTGEYHSLPAWFGHADSVENLIPENRIIRKGIRNPMLRELRQIDRQLSDPSLSAAENDALAQRASELTDALGLGLRRTTRNGFKLGEGSPASALIPERYYVKDPGHFERMVDEARTEDEARTLRAAANGDLRAQEQAALMQPDLNFNDFDYEINDPQAWLMNKMRERREQGAGWKRIKSSDGKSVVVPAAFEGHSGQLFRGLTASNGALDVLSEGHGQGLSLFRRKAAAYRTYSPPKFDEAALQNPRSIESKKAVRYFQQYADTINDHLGNSPIIQRMSRGESNDQIAHWLDTTNEGQRILRDVKPPEMPTGIWVDDHRFKFNYYVPSPKLQRLLGKGRLQPSDFRKEIPDEKLPTIYGPDLEVLDKRRGAGQFLSDWADKAWNYLGNKPIDAFSRHPFAQAMYNRKIKNLIASTDSEWLTPEYIDRLQKQAHQFALNETRRHLYNLTETTNFNDALRFIAPFWGAQYEAISKWLRIISDRPETVGRFFAAQRSVYNNFLVVDPNNNHAVVKSGTRPGGMHGLGLYHPNDMVIFQMPEFIKKKFGMQDIGSLGIPIGSANTVLQGDLPLLPSLGPIVTIPADQFMRKVSATYGVENDQSLLYRWLFPIGRPRSKDTINQVLDQFVPGWINRYRQSSGPEDSLSRINMEMLVGREMTLRNRRLGKADPTPAEIEKAANHLWHIRIISGLIQPFQTQYLPDHQYWLDAAHQYQKQYGQQWWDKFIDKYGEEAAIYATSSSNSIGVPPTDKGMEEWSKNKDLIAKYPNWTSAIISPQAYMGQFSPDAYGQQFNITLGPGDTRTLRTGSSLQDRLFNEPDIQLGWREYRKVNAAIEAELHARGLTSVQQAGAEQLALLKQAAKADIASKYPAWARAYQEQATTINADVADLQKIAGNPMFDNRPDWQGVRQYLAIREKATAILDALGQQGGSRSLQATPNQALAQWFYGQVGQLVLSNPAFAEFYTRYLSADTLTTGSGF